MRKFIFLVFSGLTLLSLSSCHTSGQGSASQESRDAKADQALAVKKAGPSGLRVGEILTEPQTGFIQETEQSQ